MTELKQKIKRVKPLIRVRQFNMEKEAAELERIRGEKRQAMSELKRYEKLYIQGVEKLNIEIQSSTRDNLDLMERGVDHYKTMWYKSLKTMREMESIERSQLNQLLMARQELQSMETLEDRYKSQAYKVEQDKEQNTNNESAIRGFNRNRS